jgi:hypothetical protein
LDLAILHNIQNYTNNKKWNKSNHAMLVDCYIRAKFYLPAVLERGPSLFSQLSSREGQVYSPSFLRERAKVFSWLSSRELKVVNHAILVR